MISQQKRIATLAVIGLLLIAVAFFARKQVMARRLAAAKARPAFEQLAAEQELVRLRNSAGSAPQDKQKQWDLANFYVKNKILKQAAEQLKVIMQLDPSDTQAMLTMADVAFQAQAYTTSESYYGAVTKVHPANITAWQGLASALTMERRFFEAIDIARRAIKLNPADSNSRLIGATALLNYSLQFPDPRSHVEYIHLAIRELTPLTKLMPDNGEVFYEYGRALMGIEKLTDAIAPLERAVKLSPDNVEGARMLAIAYRTVGRDDKALKVIQDLNGRFPDDPATNDMLGGLLIDSNQPGSLQQATEAFKRAVAKAPSDQYMLERLGQAYVKANDLQNARAIFERVTQINPNRSYSFQKLALIYTRMGETRLSKQAALLSDQIASNEMQFKRIQDLSARHPESVDLHLALANRLLALKMYAPARDEYFEVLRLDPKNKNVPKEFLKAAATDIKTGLY